MVYKACFSSNRAACAHSQGYMLLEVLVAVGILALGILGVAALQITALKASDSATLRSQAAIHISKLTNRMRANPAGAEYDLSNQYTSYTPVTNPTTQAQTDLKNWWTAVTTSHGSSAKVKLSCTGQGVLCNIGIQWQDERGDPGVDAAPPSNLFSYEVQVIF